MSAGTPRHTIRVDNELWRDFQAICANDGTDASTELRNYIIGRVISSSLPSTWLQLPPPQ